MKNNSSKIVSSSEMKNLERETFRKGVTSELLMEKAGTSVSKRIAEILGHGTILTLIGPGKNGGDGLIAATHLKKLGFRSMAITTSELTGTKLCENAQKSGVDLYELGNYKKQILLIEKFSLHQKQTFHMQPLPEGHSSVLWDASSSMRLQV